MSRKLKARLSYILKPIFCAKLLPSLIYCVFMLSHSCTRHWHLKEKWWGKNYCSKEQNNTREGCGHTSATKCQQLTTALEFCWITFVLLTVPSKRSGLQWKKWAVSYASALHSHLCSSIVMELFKILAVTFTKYRHHLANCLLYFWVPPSKWTHFLSLKYYFY